MLRSPLDCLCHQAYARGHQAPGEQNTIAVWAKRLVTVEHTPEQDCYLVSQNIRRRKEATLDTILKCSSTTQLRSSRNEKGTSTQRLPGNDSHY